MPRHVLPKLPKGQRYPGAGRKKGMPNPVSVEARVLVTQMVNDASYQARLRRDFALRKLHPTIESLVWAYAIGKPRLDVNVTGSIDVNAKLEAEKRVILQLDVAELEVLAAESQALMDRATALAALRSGHSLPQDVVVEAETVERPPETLGFSAGSDNVYDVNQSTKEDTNPISPTESEG